MSLTDFIAAQADNAEALAKAPHFATLVPIVDRMYGCVLDLAGPRCPPTLVKLLTLCHREFLVAASQIQRGLPFEAAANTRRAVEIAKVALALKRNVGNAEKWLQSAARQAKWDARQKGCKPRRLPNVRFAELANEPLLSELQDFFGMASDMYLHFTPEFFGMQDFVETIMEGDRRFVRLELFARERTVLVSALMLCGVHVRIMRVFDACFDGLVVSDGGWRLLSATFEQLGMELMRDLPPDPEPGNQVA